VDSACEVYGEGSSDSSSSEQELEGREQHVALPKPTLVTKMSRTFSDDCSRISSSEQGVEVALNER
jgi:hypothetical protein